MKAITADLPHIDGHLLVAGFNTAGLSDDDALKTHVSPATVTFQWLPASASGRNISRPVFTPCIVITPIP